MCVLVHTMLTICAFHRADQALERGQRQTTSPPDYRALVAAYAFAANPATRSAGARAAIGQRTDDCLEAVPGRERHSLPDPPPDRPAPPPSDYDRAISAPYRTPDPRHPGPPPPAPPAHTHTHP